MTHQFCDLAVLPAVEQQEMELVEVLIAEIEKTYASEALTQLNRLHPLPSLRHLKRLRQIEKEGETTLEMLLCLSENEEEAPALPAALSGFIESYQLNPVQTKVPSSVPLTKELWLQWREHWPMPFRASGEKSDEPNEEFQHRAEKYMLAVLKLIADPSTNAAIIVDPITDRVIAEGVDRSSQRHPLRHAAMEAIRLAAEGDLEAWPDKSSEPPEKRQRIEDGAEARDADRPYLCTEYEIYTLKEPCLMCAMAMVHSRFHRAVFCRADSVGGAFTVHALHRQKGLNHRYSVYQLCERQTDV